MKLFIWDAPYRVSYGCSMVFAVAETLEEAKRIAGDQTKAKAYSYGSCSNGAGGKVELGEPDRVVDVPCAEWHEWSE